MILLVVILSLFGHLFARSIDERCDGVIVHNIKHVKEVLLKDIDSPYQLAVDYDTNTLFFSYSSSDVMASLFKSAYINLKNNEFKTIDGIKGGFANGVDSQTTTVYLGGSDGLYTFDYSTGNAKHIDGTSHNIWQIFVKKDVYYSTYPDEHVYVFKNGVSTRVPELENTRAMLFALDNDGNMYFSNSSGLYLYKSAKHYVTYMGDYNLNGITSDSNGNLFFSTPNGLYYIHDDSKKIDKLVSLYNIYGLAVENDGSIIYASQDSIIRLKPTKTECIDNEKYNEHDVDVI